MSIQTPPPGAIEPLKMEVELTVIDHLGLKMYGTLPPVVSEIVANSWDADAKRVDVRIPEGSIDGNSVIKISDDGCGMGRNLINGTYLRVGRNRRIEDGTERSAGGRPLMGRKGVGKLAAFGIAGTTEIETRKGGKITAFLMDIDKIRATQSGKDYFPRVLQDNRPTDKPDGTTVTLGRLKRSNAVDIAGLRLKVARRFSVISQEFEVSINGVPITPDERGLRRDVPSDYLWEIDEFIDDGHRWRVTGWIGTTPEPISDEGLHKIVLMARGKLIQEPTLFEIAGKQQHAYPYMTGELHTEFMDAGEDLVATHRGSAIWESSEGQALMEWGQKRITKIAHEWSDKRRRAREQVIRKDPKFEAWLEGLTRPRRALADRVISAITRDDHIHDERRRELASFMMTSFEYQAFHEMVAALPVEPTNATILDVFEEWKLIEAQEIQRLVKGRITALGTLEQFVAQGAREVPEIHRHLARFPWLLDPTWTIAEDEVYFSSLLRDQFPEGLLEEPNRRVDFVCLGEADTVHVVELKRPNVPLTRAHLEQLESYVDFVRSQLGNSPERSYQSAAGYVIVGSIPNDASLREKIGRLKGDRIYVRTYVDLLRVARKLHQNLVPR